MTAYSRMTTGIKLNGGILPAMATGVLLTVAFPKPSMDAVAWIAFIPLLAVLNTASAKTGFRLGFIAGMAHYLTLIYWLVPTMHIYGYMPFVVCVPILALFCAYLSLFPAAFGALVSWLKPRPLAGMLLVPGLWVAMEYIRGFLFSGFPWELLGYTQFQRLHIAQISDIFGVYGVSFVIVLVNYTGFVVCLHLLKKPWSNEVNITRAQAIKAGFICIVVMGSVLAYGHGRIASIDRQMEAAPSMRVTIIQGNIDQGIKWEPGTRWSTTRKYINMSRSAASQAPDLVVWPETAAPFHFTHHVYAALANAVLKGIRKTGISFVVGSPAYEHKEGRDLFFNSAYLINETGSIQGRYDKVHLVPFGEYVPMKRWLPFVGKFVEHVGDFNTGDRGRTLLMENAPLGVLICYEIIFPYLSRDLAANHARLLINITNDAWYGRTSAPYQHFSMAVFRAVENRRAVVRSANTGISGFIDPVGRILETTPLYEEAARTSELPLMEETAIYTRVGDLLAIICLVMMTGCIIITRYRRKNHVH